MPKYSRRNSLKRKSLKRKSLKRKSFKKKSLRRKSLRGGAMAGPMNLADAEKNLAMAKVMDWNVFPGRSQQSMEVAEKAGRIQNLYAKINRNRRLLREIQENSNDQEFINAHSQQIIDLWNT